MQDLERFDRFNAVFHAPAHKVAPSDRTDARQELFNSMNQAYFWLEVAQAWAREIGAEMPDLDLALIDLEVAQASVPTKLHDM